MRPEMFEALLPAAPKFCFDEFCDLRTARLWLPGLKKAKVVRADGQGRALEVSYEFGESLSYALVYAYDDAGLKVRWVPSVGVRDGVSGSASFEATADGTRFRYALDSVRGRSPTHETDVAQAFVGWIRSRPRR